MVAEEKNVLYNEEFRMRERYKEIKRVRETDKQTYKKIYGLAER